MNSDPSPLLLEKNQLAFASNLTTRGAFGRTRPPVRKITLTFADAFVEERFKKGLFQGHAFYKSDYGFTSILAFISGRVFEITPDKLGNATVVERSISDEGAFDLNNSGAPLSWAWQAERWVIINDGEHLPIIFDGQTSRRSRGPSTQVGVTAADFFVPAVGSTVSITLVDNYEGPVNENILIGPSGGPSAYYQVKPTGVGGYKTTIKNLSAPNGTAYAAGLPLVIPSNLIGQLIQDATVVFNNATLRFTPPISPVESVVSIQTTGQTFRVLDRGITNNGAGSIVANNGTNGEVFETGSPVFDGYFQATSFAGLLFQSFNSPNVGASTDIFLVEPYVGALGVKVVIGGELFEITAAENTLTVASNVITIENVNDTPGNTVSTGAILLTIPELPIGKMGAYGMGRNWMALADGKQFIAGDIVGGSAGSPATAGRDAVLKVTENEFLAGGGAFSVPGNIGSITAMLFGSTLDVSLGQGPLQVHTSSSVFTCITPVDRLVWASITNPILTEALIGKGALSHAGTIQHNNDTFFRAVDGNRSLILARREFSTWGNVPISDEMRVTLEADNEELLQFESKVVFDNRLLATASPLQTTQGVIHRKLIALNFDALSSLRGKTPAVYDGEWTGLNVLQIGMSQFGKRDRAFAFTLNTEKQEIELWEFQREKEAFADNGAEPILWGFETPSLLKSTKGKAIEDLARLMDGEIYVDQVRGRVDFQVFYKPDQHPCWTPWHAWGINFANEDMAAKPTGYAPRMGFGEPSGKICDTITERVMREGHTFQVKVIVSGHCRVLGLKIKAVPAPQPMFAIPICNAQ